MISSISTSPRWEAQPKNDRLKRWCVVNAADPGRGKQVIADNIRSEEQARLIASAPALRSFALSLTDATGPYPMVDGTRVVSDARAVLATTEVAA